MLWPETEGLAQGDVPGLSRGLFKMSETGSFLSTNLWPLGEVHRPLLGMLFLNAQNAELTKQTPEMPWVSNY